jgi:hypothetical protein
MLCTSSIQYILGITNLHLVHSQIMGFVSFFLLKSKELHLITSKRFFGISVKILIMRYYCSNKIHLDLHNLLVLQLVVLLVKFKNLDHFAMLVA